jgi:predicted lipoprotein with Yx(FWY)xxD motif
VIGPTEESEMIDRMARGRRAMFGAGLVASAALLLAACSSTGAAQTATPTSASAASLAAPASAPAASPAASAPAASAEAAGGGSVYEVKAATSAAAGAYMAGEDGKTLYIYTKDSPGKSVCDGGCATAWPPFILGPGETVKAGTGVSGTFATIRRDDGSMQVTYNDVPVYYFAADQKAGDVTGQGVGGVWYVAAP